MATKDINWREYFEKTKGTGILATADKGGNVDLAIYARPHVRDDGSLAFIMQPKLSLQNLKTNVRAAYMFIEEGDGYHGHRLYLTKVHEESDPELIESLRRSHHGKWAQEGPEKASLVSFRIDSVRPLVGDNPLEDNQRWMPV